MQRFLLGILLVLLAISYFIRRAVRSLKTRVTGEPSPTRPSTRIFPTDTLAKASQYDVPIPTYDELGCVNAWRYMWLWTPRRSSVLDVGCSTGYLGAWLAQTRECVVDGVEIDPRDRTIAAKRLHTVYDVNLENPDSHKQIPNRYDVILLMDVLEHVRNPDLMLAQIKQLLKPEGVLIVNVPNVANWQLRFSLLRGRWDYQDTGLLDRTHVYFYTISTLQERLERNGWRIGILQPSLPADRLFTHDFSGSAWRQRIVKACCQAFPGLLAYQITALARPD